MMQNDDQRRRLFCILRRIAVPPWSARLTIKFQKTEVIL